MTGLSWLSAHGGSGCTTLRRCVGTGKEVSRLPAVDSSELLVVVARTDARGLQRVQQIAGIHAARGTDSLLPALVLVADAPGKLPRPLQDLSDLVSGGFEATWRIPWVPEWRLGATAELASAPEAVRRLARELMASVEAEVPAVPLPFVPDVLALEPPRPPGPVLSRRNILQAGALAVLAVPAGVDIARQIFSSPVGTARAATLTQESVVPAETGPGPTLISFPVITGTPEVGQDLTCSEGVWE